MKKFNISIVLLHTNTNKILMQDRRSISKWGEHWGFWGGRIEKDETPADAAIREIKEELHFDIKEMIYLGKVTGTTKHIKLNESFDVTVEIFSSVVSEDLSQFTVLEGDGAEFVTFDKIKKLKLEPVTGYKILDIFEKYLKKKKQTKLTNF